MWVLSLHWEDPLEQKTATHFSVLAWRIPWTDEPGGLQSKGSQESDRIENQATEQHLAHFQHHACCLVRQQGTLFTSSELAKPEQNPRGPLTWPCTGLSGLSWEWQQVPPLRGQTLSHGPQTSAWEWRSTWSQAPRIGGWRGEVVTSPHPLLRNRGGEQPLEPAPRTPPALLSLLLLLLISLLRARPPAPLIRDSPPDHVPFSFYRPTVLTSMVMTQFTLSEDHGHVSKSSWTLHSLPRPLLEPL